jgi:hypothetical protein
VTATIADVLPAAAAVLGVPAGRDELGLLERVGPTPRVLVVLVDGLGARLLPLLASRAPFLADVLAGAAGDLAELQCTFPSTTPTSLVSLGTGAQPGEHGVVGFTVNVPGTDRVLTHIVWRDDPPPRTWQPLPTWFERIAAAGARATVVLPRMFAGSGLTDSAYRGARFCGVRSRDDYAQRLLAELRAGPGLVYGYTAVLDTAAHVHGVGTPEWLDAATQVDELLRRLVENLPADAVLLVTADHGGLNVGPGDRVDLAADPRLTAGVRVVAGEPRVRYLHTRPGAATDVLGNWQGVLGDAATVLARDDAVARGLFGSVRPEHRERIGDVVVICGAPIAVLATGYEPPEVGRLVGFHGALTDAETAIPLITVRG